MKIFFSCSARGYKEYGESYDKIFSIIQQLGHMHLDDYHENMDPNRIYNSTHDENLKLYKQSMESIRKCDVCVVEVSTHSLTMGYLLQQALNMGKPVIALHMPSNRPVFIAGIEDEKLQVVEYTLENLHNELEAALQNAQENIDVRFNFFISPSIGRYLDWVSKVKKIPRSVYLRALIEREMRENKEYQDE